MKKIIYYFITLVSMLFVLASCNDSFMDRYPEDKINDETYWNTASDLRIYANQFYTSMNTLYAYSTDDESDNQANRTKDDYLWSDYTIPTSGGGWSKSDWSDIRSCNYFLTHCGTATGQTDEINQYKGEVYFFKAKFYYEKVLRFGDVPWLSKELTTSSEELYYPRNDRAEVMDSICACLDSAIALLPEETSDNRLTKYAALTLKSRACLFEGTWRKYRSLDNYEKYLQACADACEEIMNSGLFEIYSTGDVKNDYHNLFNQQDYADNPEAIFYVSYITDSRMHNRTRSVRECGSGMTKDFVESFLCTDGLPIGLSPLYQGDAEYDDEFENRDPRLAQCVYTSDYPWNINGTDTTYVTDLPTFNNFFSTGYRIYKVFSPLETDFEYNRNTLDDLVYRYGEVLLNYAESMAELGECTQTVLDNSINLLRDRVGMPHMTVDISFTDPNWPDWEVSVTPLINEIRRERRVELACEGLRWNDICRWKAGKLLENPNTYLGARDPDTGEYRVIYEGMTRTWYDRLYLRPIPTDELNYNPNLTQNPGWE